MSSISVIQTFDPVHAGEGFAALHGLRRRGAGAMSLFPGGSAQPEPLLGMPGASSHLQATVPTLLQALSASESTAPPRGQKSKPAVAKGCWLGWPAGRRPGQLGRGVALATAASWPKPRASLLWTLLARPQRRVLTSRGCPDPAGYLDRLSALALAQRETW